MNSEILKKQVKKDIDREVGNVLKDYDTGKVLSTIEDDGIEIIYTLKFPYLKEKPIEIPNETENNDWKDVLNHYAGKKVV